MQDGRRVSEAEQTHRDAVDGMAALRRMLGYRLDSEDRETLMQAHLTLDAINFAAVATMKREAKVSPAADWVSRKSVR